MCVALENGYREFIMRLRPVLARVVAALVCAVLAGPPVHAADGGPLTVTSAKVTLDGTSNIHAYSASTTDVRVTAIELAGAAPDDVLAYVLQPGAITAFDVVIPAANLTSEKADLTRNMHKALKVQEFTEIRFRLRTIEAAGAGYRAVGRLTIAGVEREVVLNAQVVRQGAALAVTGATDLLMTDYGITPPRAMLGMLKTNPKVQIRIELLLGA
jgi:hypothetical protein